MGLKLKGVESASRPSPDLSCGLRARASQLAPGDAQIPALARAAVETFVLTRRVVEPPRHPHTPLLNQPSACFVCIKTLARELRGCIGSIEPGKSTLAEEIIANAIKAATRDTRFDPLAAEELPSLQYSVDVLGSLEPARPDDLNPSAFGVLVTNHVGSRRGLLLPAIDGVTTPEQQIALAARKAGIPPGEPLKLYRFRTQRFGEWM